MHTQDLRLVYKRASPKALGAPRPRHDAASYDARPEVTAFREWPETGAWLLLYTPAIPYAMRHEGQP